MSKFHHNYPQPAASVRGNAIFPTMKKAIFLLLFACSSTLTLVAQQPVVVEHPLLNSAQLDRQPWFYNLDSALANPDKVYKLSLIDQKIKTLPPEFGQFRNLQVLTISNCKLKEIPVEIKECKNLQTVSLYGNKIRLLPAEMRELKQLETLFLGKNRLFELPNWLGTLTKIQRLDISRNALTPADVSNAKRMLPKAHITS